MPFICCVTGCGETGKRILHSFPKNPSQCKRWIEATWCFFLNEETAWKSHYKVCRKHFDPTDFKNWNLLKRDVVPGVMLPHSISMEHDYCARNSIIVSVNNVNRDENVSVALSHNESIEEIHIAVEEHVIDVAEDIFQNQQENEHQLENNMEEELFDGNNDFGNVVCNSIADPLPNATKTTLESCGQQNFKKKQRRTYDPVARKMKYLLDRNKALAKKLKESQEANLKSNKQSKVKKRIDGVLKTLSLELPPAQFNFIKLQIKNTGKAMKGNRFTFEEKTLALTIYKQNPKRYNNFRKISRLPTRQTLIAHSAAIRFKEGINQNLMDFITKEVSSMEELNKMCTLGWDEMSLTANLAFDHIKDYIDGFEDLASKRTNNIATQTLVFMVRGIKSAFKQPVAYFLTENLNATELAELVKLVTIAVQATGLQVIGSVCDAVNTNRAAVNKLIGRKGRQSSEGELLEYFINGSKIWHYFDPPHLIKSVRNNLLVKNLIHTVSFNETKFRPCGTIAWNEKNKQQRTASWNDIAKFYEYNNTHNKGLFSLIPKITGEHIIPERRKMKVSLATQIFSGTYGRNMYLCSKRKECAYNWTGTAAILLFFNDLFDSVNGDGAPVPDKLIGSVTQNTKHFVFWNYAVRMLESMKFAENLKTGNPNQSNVFKHFVSTLKGMRQICEHLFVLGFESIGLRRLDQDGLENHFFKIRNNCGSNPKPNARDFRNAYTTSILNNQLSSHSLNANCESDNDNYMLENLQILFTQTEGTSRPDSILQNTPTQAFGNGSKELNSADISSMNFPENEAENCISGRICKILLTKIKCTSCTATVTATKKEKYLDVMRKQSSADEMVMPKLEFIDCIKILIAKLKCMLPHLCAEKNLIQKLLPGLSFENKNDEIIGCDLHRIEFIKEMKKTTAKLAIERFTQQVNRILSGKVTVAAEPIIQKKALEFRTKKKNIGKFAPSTPHF